MSVIIISQFAKINEKGKKSQKTEENKKKLKQSYPATIISWADNSCQALLISIPKADLYNIKPHSKFGENPLIFTQVIIWNPDVSWADNCQKLRKFVH